MRQDTLARWPHLRHVHISNSLPGQPADSLWKIQTSGAAKIVSRVQRSRLFCRGSISQSRFLQRLQGGFSPVATGAALSGSLN
ncbi:MAG: hypothetical protein ACRD2A_13780 [Vicinamibacterales bacterium]